MQQDQLGLIALVIVTSLAAGLFADWTRRLWFKDEHWRNYEFRYVKLQRHSFWWWANLVVNAVGAIVITAIAGMYLGMLIRS